MGCHLEDGLRTVHSNPEIDLILMDIDPGFGIAGTEIAAVIQNDRHLPLVLISGLFAVKSLPVDILTEPEI